MTKLLNPRGYLSWTQVSMWLRDPERYVRQYMHGEEDFKNAAMDFGSRAARALETGEEDADEMINMLASLLTKYPKMEHEIKVPFKTPKGQVILLGKLDTFRPKPLAFREYKTGRTKWTLSKAKSHGQNTHYSALVYLENGAIPEAHLDWAQTEYGEEGVYLTGKIETFEVTKTMREVLIYLADVSRVAVEIDARYRAELKKLA